MVGMFVCECGAHQFVVLHGQWDVGEKKQLWAPVTIICAACGDAQGVDARWGDTEAASTMAEEKP